MPEQSQILLIWMLLRVARYRFGLGPPAQTFHPSPCVAPSRQADFTPHQPVYSRLRLSMSPVTSVALSRNKNPKTKIIKAIQDAQEVLGAFQVLVVQVIAFGALVYLLLQAIH
jgi:hypothetical protein